MLAVRRSAANVHHSSAGTITPSRNRRALRARRTALVFLTVLVTLFSALGAVGSTAMAQTNDRDRIVPTASTDSESTALMGRISFGTMAPHLRKIIVPTHGQFMGGQLSTYYGPGFWGNRTACGQTLKRETWGIAHRTLACGTMVTLAYGRRRVAVPVIDRGPFSGATVDLTQRTSDFLRVTDVGHARVAMAVVDRYRIHSGSGSARS